jgi:hypothetical protein
MGVGTLSAITVQSGSLVQAGFIGDGLDTARESVSGTHIPAVLPQIIPPLDGQPGGTTTSVGNPDPVGGVVEIAQGTGHTGGGGGSIGTGSDDPDECPALEVIVAPGDLECDEQADGDV